MIIRPKEDWIAILILTLIIVFIVLSGMMASGTAHAYEYAHPENTLYIKAIVGEALPDYASMYAIACAIRNRGHLRGVYGVHAKHLKTASDELFLKAETAWFASGLKDSEDVVKGATHWLSDYDLKHSKPALIAFRFKMKETAYIGQTHFYR